MSRTTTNLPHPLDVFASLDRPPWHAVSSHELADMFGVGLNWVWNHTMRKTGPQPEADRLHVRASNRRFFMPCVVLEWLSSKEGTPEPAWRWCRAWLAERRLAPPEASAATVLDAVIGLDRAGIYKRQWKVRKDLYAPRLAEMLLFDGEVKAPAIPLTFYRGESEMIPRAVGC